MQPTATEQAAFDRAGMASETPAALLTKIISVVGTPAPDAVDQMHKADAKAWMQQQLQRPVASSLAARFPTGGVAWAEQAVDLLTRLLAWDPAGRPTARQAMAHPFFATLHPTRRLPPTDPAAVVRVDLDRIERLPLDANAMRRELNALIREYHPGYAPVAAAAAVGAAAAAFPADATGMAD